MLRVTLTAFVGDPNPCDALADEAEFPGRGQSHVDDASFGEGPTVVDADRDGFTVRQVGHLHHGSEGEGSVCGRQTIGIGSFTAGCLATQLVPGSFAALLKAFGRECRSAVENQDCAYARRSQPVELRFDRKIHECFHWCGGRMDPVKDKLQSMNINLRRALTSPW